MTADDIAKLGTPLTRAITDKHSALAGLDEIARYYNQLFDFARHIERDRAALIDTVWHLIRYPLDDTTARETIEAIAQREKEIANG